MRHGGVFLVTRSVEKVPRMTGADMELCVCCALVTCSMRHFTRTTVTDTAGALYGNAAYYDPVTFS